MVSCLWGCSHNAPKSNNNEGLYRQFESGVVASRLRRVSLEGPVGTQGVLPISIVSGSMIPQAWCSMGGVMRPRRNPLDLRRHWPGTFGGGQRQPAAETFGFNARWTVMRLTPSALAMAEGPRP